MKTLILVISIILLAGCVTPEKKVLGDIVTRNAVAQYIQSADDPKARADRVSKKLDQIEAAASVGMSSGSLKDLLEAKLMSGDLSPADRLLLKDALELTTARLSVPKLPESDAYAIVQNFVKQARLAVSLYK